MPDHSPGTSPKVSSSEAVLEHYGRGSTDRDIRRASAHPGRIVSGVTLRASRTEASAAFVVGRSTAAVIDLVAMPTMAL
ncbi:hypothetical protein NGB36_26790 [Streptomyces sp. RB6PN25]|uniref:Uncharacterized protein n=1 Tax=Streptomyces humicola TaxID=2953240 RepID=A0ABT1Q3W5_9ACTN|nr:hypothetical protein [Streptomyces humicola]MCQ4084083.1 hypothetical protein [Streptomyces humicola]